jgi:hypothetical protein
MKSIIEPERIAKFCRPAATLLCPTSRNIRDLRADLRSTYEIDGGFAIPEAAALKNVLAARQLLPEENSAEVPYVLPSWGITINEFGRAPSRESYKETRRLNGNSMPCRLLGRHERERGNTGRME